tara:strand:- start:943 stop:3375 length:2433 start_codon:yes stop_codon:yes gene_type:complete
MSEFLNNYFKNRFFNIGVGEALETVDPLAAPLLPFANPFAERKKPRFPVPSDFRKPVVPDIEMEVIPSDESGSGGDDFYSPGYDPTTGERREEPSVKPIDSKQGMASYIVEEQTPETGIKGLINAAVQKELAFPTRFNPITATDRVTGVSGAMGNIPMGVTTLGALTEIGDYYNRRNLSDIAARAALGQKGYAVGMFENQIVGTKPNAPIPQGSPVVPSALQNKVVKQLQELGQQGKGSGVLGKAYGQYIDRGARFNMSKAVTPEMIAYESVVKGLKIDDDLKKQLLGFGNRVPDSIQPSNYYTITPYEQIQKDIEQAKLNRLGDVDSGFTDVSAPSMGLETDIDAQQSQVNPMGINIGLDTTTGSDFMSDISDIASGGNSLDAGGGPTGGSSGLNASQPPSYDDNNDSDGGSSSGSSGGDSGFGGGGWTAYGGKIGMSNGGFASKTQTIKGVGLIKPEETFMDTDVVRDRYEFPAENGDYIVNGPSSDVMKPQIATLIDYGINQLKKEGVDIRIGNPKIKGKNKVPLVVASSETYIPRVIAEKIGYPILDALNNIGKPEVRRLKNKLDNEPTDKGKYEANEGMRVGEPIPNSFMTMEEADKALGVKPEPLDPKTLKLFKLYNKKGKPQRGDVESLLDSISDKEKLALLIATETISSKDPLETLESVGQVVINRINDKQFPDFKNVNTLDQVLKQRSSRGGGTKMFQFDGLEPTSVKKRINEFLNKGGIKGYRRALTAAENVLTKGSGEPDYMMERMPFNVLFYDKAGSPTSISRRYKSGKDVGPNELIDEYGKVGDHTFYSLHMTKEYP